MYRILNSIVKSTKNSLIKETNVNIKYYVSIVNCQLKLRRSDNNVEIKS